MEAGSDKHLESLNKRSSVQLNIDAQRVMDDLDIENWAHFVVMPDFLKEDFDELWDFIETQGITYPVFVPMTPIPGTPLFFESKEKKTIKTFDYGFYNLEYMCMETKLPKREWYDHFLGLYDKSCSLPTLWRRRKVPAFHARPALGRAYVMGKIVKTLRPHIEEQIIHEREAEGRDIDATLPPGMRRDYKPVNYYNPQNIAAIVDERMILSQDGKSCAGVDEAIAFA